MLFEMLIAQLCLSTPLGYRPACSKAVEAASVQYEIKQGATTAEKRTADFIERRVETVTGRETLAVVLFTAKVFKDQEVSTNLVRERGKMPSVNLGGTKERGRIMFTWSF